MQPQLPAPTASGSFLKTPFPHLLVYALERGLTGTFELSRGAASLATMLVIGGCPAKVRTTEPVHFLGSVMLDLGMITPEQLHAALDRMAQQPQLLGNILLEIGATDPARLDAGLRAQVDRKVEHLFGLPTETTFAYYDGVDLIHAYGGPPTPIDPFPVLWRGVRESPVWEHVDATLRRVGSALVSVSAIAQLERFAFSPQELEVINVLRQRPLRLIDITNILGPAIGQALVYLLMIMKQVDLIDAAQVPLLARPPSSAQAFARVQLHRQTSTRTPVVVEEVIAPSSSMLDERTSSSRMEAPPSAFTVKQPRGGAFGPPSGPQSEPTGPVIGAERPGRGPLDIGSMITQTIQSSLPPEPPPSAEAVPVFAQQGVPSDIVPASTPAGAPSSPPLTNEQNALKSKIIERADQITSQDYFQMLGVHRDAPPETVQKAFFALAKVWHPDRLPPALVDVKDACSKVFTHLTEAHAVLMDATRRQDYMLLLKDGGATPEDQAMIQSVIEAATEFQKAEFLLKRNTTDPQAYELVRRSVMLDGGQADYLATLAWLDAQKPEWLSREKTLEKCLILDRCIGMNPNCERAYFYRGLLYKRAEEVSKALKDFKKAAELNPRNLDAMREVRLHNMRGGMSKPPPPPGSGRPPKPAPTETLGGIFGKLFKK